MQRLGADHPIIKTQYRLLEIDEAGRLFTLERQSRMRGTHPRQLTALPGDVYALTIDVGGEEEQTEGGVAASLASSEQPREAKPWRDSTAVTAFRVDLSPVDDPLIGFPRYEVVNRYW